MRINISLWLTALFLPVLLVSCAEEEETYTLSNNCYISDVTLGYVRRTIHTVTHEGKDSTYTVTFDGKYYPMTVDQRNLLIYNEDSLPKNTRVSAILATINAEGYVMYRPAGNSEAEWVSYSATDSIDFSTPLSLVVTSSDGTARREYTLKVNVHRQDGDEFVWKKMPSADVLQGMEQMKAVGMADRLLVLGHVDGEVRLASMVLPYGLEWTSHVVTGCEGADVASLQRLGDKLYMNTNGGQVLCSTDGQDWETVGTAPVERLIAAGSNCLYAMGQGQILRSADGRDWIPETMDAGASWLPVQDIASVCYRQTNGNDRLLLMGNRDVELFAADTATVVWGKYWNRFQMEENSGWMFFNASPDNRYLCPRLKDLSVIHYDNMLIACGGASIDGKHAALDAFYISLDNGITWKTDETLMPPSELKGTGWPIVVSVDVDSFVWLICGTEVWRGRLNRLGFE